jgi:hypothetical protein
LKIEFYINLIVVTNSKIYKCKKITEDMEKKFLIIGINDGEIRKDFVKLVNTNEFEINHVYPSEGLEGITKRLTEASIGSREPYVLMDANFPIKLGPFDSIKKIFDRMIELKYNPDERLLGLVISPYVNKLRTENYKIVGKPILKEDEQKLLTFLGH